MVKLVFCEIDREEKVKVCKKIMEEAYNKFFNICGVKNIEKICNENRTKLLKECLEKDQNYIMPKSKYPCKKIIEEICLPFDLYEPEIIEICVLKGIKPQDNHAMDIRHLNNELTKWMIVVYLDTMDYVNGNLTWIGFQETIEEISYHEFLHACGDHPLRKRHDGILRHNEIGINAIKLCLEPYKDLYESL